MFAQSFCICLVSDVPHAVSTGYSLNYRPRVHSHADNVPSVARLHFQGLHRDICRPKGPDLSGNYHHCHILPH